MTTKDDVAAWMLSQIESHGHLYQEDAAQEIERRFGSDWVYENDNGNPAISRSALDAFRKVRPNHIEWDSSDKSWC